LKRAFCRFRTSPGPKHVITAPVAAPHHAASSGTAIGRVDMDSHFRGHDVLEDGRAREWQVEYRAFHTTPSLNRFAGPGPASGHAKAGPTN